MKKIKHVTQYTPRACVAACIEMVTFGALDQREIHRQMKADSGRHGTGTEDEYRQLVRMGFMPIPAVMNQLTMGDLLLVTVPSLNIIGGNHRVVIDLRDEHVLYDPNEGREGAKLYDKDMQNLNGFSEVTRVIDCRLEPADA